MDLTMRQWNALRDRQTEKLRRGDSMVELMLAQTIAMIGNTGFRGYDKPRQPSEFMPTEWSKPAAKADPAAMVEDTRSYFAALRVLDT
jgi:hypothetical protein